MSSSVELRYKFQKKRDKAKRDLDDRKNEIFTFIPRIKAIEKEINRLGLNIAKAVILDANKSGDELSKIKHKMKLLKQEEAVLLTEHNVPMDYLTLHFACAKCSDTGFMENGMMCNCYKQEMITAHYKHSNLTEVINNENFSTFNIEIFSDEYNEDLKKSTREHMISVLATCESFVYNFEQKKQKNLIFYGSTGLGKTFLCNCIAKALLDKGVTVLYQTAFRIVDTISSYRFAPKKTAQMKENYELLITCDLLIIDDLGTEMINSFTNTEIFNIINTRLLENRKTIISTNFSPMQVKENYSDRVSSRIFGHYEFVAFSGKDLRWEN